MRAERVLVRAPGRVNLIGDHIDYVGGHVLPAAIDRWTAIEFERMEQEWVEITSADEPDPAVIPLDVQNPSLGHPKWARYPAGVIAVMQPELGGRGFVTSTIPIGAGLSSSAALTVASALALGFEGTRADLAVLCQQAEQVASGVPCGVMDQLASAAGVEGHALLIDCSTLDVRPVPIPFEVDIVVIDSGERRELASSQYAVRRRQCEEVEEMIGPLRNAVFADLADIDDELLRARARHVITENQRVLEMAGALQSGDLSGIGELMRESHSSLRDDFDVSTRLVDDLVEAVAAIPGVYGARMTGGGFGGAVVALTEPAVAEEIPGAWRFTPVAGATVEVV